MIRVEEAEKIILSQLKDYGTELVAFNKAAGRVLAENIQADRDFPPFNRVTMDGIAINYSAIESGIRSFRILATQAAGDKPPDMINPDECVEIMTGAALPGFADTIIPYEAIKIEKDIATILHNDIRRGQNIHPKGRDKKQYATLVSPGEIINPPVSAILASVGKSEVKVKKLPAVVVASSGDELVSVERTPNPYQQRISNSYMIAAALNEHQLQPVTEHLQDDPVTIEKNLSAWLQQYDVIILSGGVSKGKYDHIPGVLEKLSVKCLFHKVQQRPGKPFWFGADQQGKLVFALPGNPVSSFFCLTRYFIPWLYASLGVADMPPVYALLGRDITFSLPLQYFLQVNMQADNNGMLVAEPVEGNGSGDFANLLRSNAFMELPLEESNFKQGHVYRVWPFKHIST